jgi:hypothetical protein
MLFAKRNKQLRFLVFSYIPLALILAYVYLSGPGIVYRDSHYPKHEIDDEDIANFNLVAPYVCSFLFVLLTAYFVSYYLSSAALLVKDLKGNVKRIVFVNPEKTEMGFFNKYYVTSPISKKQQISLSKDAFQNISNDELLALDLAPNSLEILRITSKEKEILFYE